MSRQAAQLFPHLIKKIRYLRRGVFTSFAKNSTNISGPDLTPDLSGRFRHPHFLHQ